MKKHTLPMIIAATAVAAIAGVTLLAAPAPAPAPAPAEKAIKYVNLDVSADKITWNQTNERALLAGEVTLVHGDTTFKADQVDYNKKGQSARAVGKPHITSPQNDLAGETMDVDFTKKLALIRGNVKILARPKEGADAPADGGKSTRSQLKEPMTVICDQVEYYYKEKRMVASGNLKIIQKDRNATAEKAVYTQSDELAVLTGNVHSTDAKGQTFTSPRVVISMKKGDNWLEAEKVKATFMIKDEEETPATSEKPKAPEADKQSKPATQ